jgi:hypothetical protein
MIYRVFHENLSLFFRQTLYYHFVMMGGPENKGDPTLTLRQAQGRPFHPLNAAHIVPDGGFRDRVHQSKPSEGNEALVCGYNTF